MMHLKIYTIIAIVCFFVLWNRVIAQTNPANNIATNELTSAGQNGLTADWYSKAMENIRQLEEKFYTQNTSGTFRVANATNRLSFLINPAGYAVHNIRQQQEEADWQVNFNLQGIGRNGLQWTPGDKYLIQDETNSLTYVFPAVNVEYNNNNDGLRQNFIVKEKVAGKGSLKVFIEIKGDLPAKLVSDNKLAFYSPDNANNIRLVYEDLKVWDSQHRPLPASIKLSGRLLTIEVDDSQAAYPVTIDPINKNPEWNTSVNGVISTLLTDTQLKTSLYGFAVTGLGDVNGDGYGDAAISAPALIDVFSGSGSLASVGAVFVFYGSSNGLSTTPAKTLQPNTAIAGALFGFSVDGGDVTGDGINDIIIGAPADRIDLTIGILPVHGAVGKVYIYPGGNLAAPNPTNFLTINLSTSQIGLLNLSNNALFGFSVAVTEDLNGDTKRDIIVGSPTYAGAAALLVKTGGAFVFLSGSGNTWPTIQSLDVPTFSLLGINIPLINSINGLLFGYSVDGAGDYNGDNKPDVVAGAPAGIDISSLSGILSGQVLGGQAFVYYGKANNTGVNNAIGAKLQASSGSLLGNAANLFGYKVKGQRSVNGIRTGGILVGAPVGGLIPNLLGLTVQTGNVNVFKKKSGSPAGIVTPDQQIESPRSTSLLQVLNSLNLNVLFGTSLDNAYDVNCDGFPDLVVGEPLSSGATLLQLQANAVGGSAYVYIGDGTGGYVSTPKFEASTTYGDDILSVNATSLFGFSVAGAPIVKGSGSVARILVGSPSGALDFTSGVLNLGNTLGTLFDFAVGNNGLGKSYLFDANLCAPGKTPGILPVTIVAFKGQEKNKTVVLHWITTDEKNVSRYEIQKSVDGLHFETIGLNFSWDNSSDNTYYFTDGKPAQGVNYYRLNIIDKDGGAKYSSILTFKLNDKQEATVTLAPNPMTSRVRISLSGMATGSYKLELRNVTGQLQYTSTININQYETTTYIDRTSSMAAGLYWLSIYDKNNQRIITNRVIVQ